METAILLFSGITPLDAIGPYEVLSRMPGSQVKFVGEKIGPVQSHNKMCSLHVDYSLVDVSHPDLVVIPGGWGTEAAATNPQIIKWIQQVHTRSKWTTSVCTGALLLGAAGILDRIEATTHWTALEDLKQFGAIPVHERVVQSGKVITAAGVSAGIDMALHLITLVMNKEFAQAIQLSMEYDPNPPFDSGSPQKVSPDVLDLLLKLNH